MTAPRYSFDLASPADEPDLRARMAADILPGPISVSFRREPDYFAGCHVFGATHQVLRCRDEQSGQLVGLGMRALFPAFVNGVVQRHGYLADLRGAPAYRGGPLLARGYQALARLHAADPVPLYDSLILAGNDAALNLLTKPRKGGMMPRYRPMGRIISPLLMPGGWQRRQRLDGISIQRGSVEQLPAIMAFHAAQSARRQFAPLLTAADFGTPRLHGLTAQDILLACRDNRIIGMLTLWDQKGFRQTHIEGYSGPLRLIRPGVNLLHRALGRPALPAPGARIPYLYAALMAIEGDDPATLSALLHEGLRICAAGPWHYLLPCLHERDTLAEALTGLRAMAAGGHLFCVHYPDGAAAYDGLDSRTPHIELAMK